MIQQTMAAWVDETLGGMQLEEKIGHLLCPMDRGYSSQEYLEITKTVPLGTVFIGKRKPEVVREIVSCLQNSSRIPVLMAADIENGLGSPFGIDASYTEFPSQMACCAAGRVDWVEEMGAAIAREARSLGIHWSFAPVVDINFNPRNVVVNYRAFGDEADQVRAYSVARIRGMQRNNQLAACAKHFPGDGLDERDQHYCTTINSFTVEKWWETYGRVWKGVIAEGVMSIMSGHISFPQYEGIPSHSRQAMPATLSKKVQVDLLRKELGFDGVLISDAMPMGGMTSRCSSRQLAVQNILSGSDICLFADPVEDFKRLMEAVSDGRITVERIDESVRRILHLKAKLGLHTSPEFKPLALSEQVDFKFRAEKIADRAVTVLRNETNFSCRLPAGAKVLLVTVISNRMSYAGIGFETITDELHKRGIQATSVINPDHKELIDQCVAYDWVFFNICVIPHGTTGTIRLAGDLLKPFWRTFWVDFDKVTFTSFGSPYILYDLPHLSNLLCTYDFSQAAQKAAVKVWLGEIEPLGRRPVKVMPEE